MGESLEIWQLTLTNRRQQPARLSVFSSIEFCLWDAQDDATSLQCNLNIGEVEIELEFPIFRGLHIISAVISLVHT